MCCSLLALVRLEYSTQFSTSQCQVVMDSPLFPCKHPGALGAGIDSPETNKRPKFGISVQNNWDKDVALKARDCAQEAGCFTLGKRHAAIGKSCLPYEGRPSEVATGCEGATQLSPLPLYPLYLLLYA